MAIGRRDRIVDQISCEDKHFGEIIYCSKNFGSAVVKAAGFSSAIQCPVLGTRRLVTFFVVSLRKFTRRMFRQCTALFLLLAFIASTFSKAVIVADFYVNQDYIAKNLCENRGNPLMHCCGRCQLHKRLNKDANQEQNNPERRADNKEVIFFEESAADLMAPIVSETFLPYGRMIVPGPVDQYAVIEHPPA